MSYSQITEGVIIVFDKTSLKSFIAEKILERIKVAYNKNIFTAIVGIKSDLSSIIH